MKPIIALGILLFAAAPSFGQETGKTPRVLLSPVDHPAMETAFVPPREAAPKPDPFWYEKTGFRKGVRGAAVTDEELSAAPDVAVLARGFYEPWQTLLAGLQEPAFPAGPNDIAALAATKPLLIIPSGALAGTTKSDFFRAGLAAYAESGGVIFCMTQRSGAEYAALPAPAGRTVTAAGWSEDFGPLYKASTVKNRHPLLSQVSLSVPAVETDGYLISYPESARVLLARQDGHPTAIVYPFGKGWVVATTLFTDFASLLGESAPDEIALFRGLLAWARERSPNSAPRSSGAAGSSLAGQAEPSPPTASLPAYAASARPRVRAAIARNKDRLTVTLDIASSPQFAGQNAIARAGNEEKQFKLEKEATRVSFELAAAEGAQRIPYALYHAGGRAFARGSLMVPPAGGGVSPDRPFYSPGDQAIVNVSGLGKGEFTLSGMGVFDNAILGERGSMSFATPVDLPAGVYPLHWELENVNGKKKQGDVLASVAGYGAVFEDVSFAKRPAPGKGNEVAFKIRSSQKISGRLSVVLRDPEGKSTPVAEPVVSLAAGLQTVTVPFSFPAEKAGPWELVYILYVSLPPGPGIPSGPLALSAGTTLFDAGKAAVLGLATGSPLYYEPSGVVETTAFIFGNGKADVELALDGKRVARERIDLSGLYRLHASLPQPEAGTHTIRASVSSDGSESSDELLFTYGLSLPDLTVDLEVPDFRGTIAPVAVTVKNRGKSNAGSSQVSLFEGDPKSGALIAQTGIPPLAPGGYYPVKLDWPVARKAGKRTLVAVVEPTAGQADARGKNNIASKNVIVPDVLLALTAVKNSLSSGETLTFTAAAANLTSRAYKTLKLAVNLLDQKGAAVALGKMPVPELAPGQQDIQGSLRPSLLPAGPYRLEAKLSRDSVLASGEAEVAVLPTLLLTGDLDGTPDRALLCRPFTVRSDTKSAGNVAPSSGTITVEIIAAGADKPALTRQLAFAAGSKNVEIGKKDLPKQGDYTLRLKAAAADRQYGLRGEFVLAEKQLTVAGPIAIEKSHAPFPRVLLWLGDSGTEVEQALTNSLVKDAFDQEDMYYKVVRSVEDFTAQAMTGLFNTLVLVEPDELLDKPEWLQESIGRGSGVLLIGSGDTARSFAESLGFTFGEVFLPPAGTTITLDAKAGIGLSGSFPVSGQALVPQKKGARQAAAYSDKKPAILVDPSRKGKVLLLPFSLSRSAFDAGTISLYSLLLRTAAVAAAPESEEAAGTGQIAVTSLAGSVKAKIKEMLPPGAKVLWTNADGSVSGNTITYELTAEREPRKLHYVYQPAGQEKSRTSTEVFYDCDGVFESQGKLE